MTSFKKVILVIAAIIFSLYAFAQDTYQLTGKVISQDGKPIIAATLTLLPDKIIEKTDSKGTYSFKLTYSGTYTIQINALGFVEYMDTVFINSSKTLKNFTLQEKENTIEEVQIQGYQSAVDNLISAKNAAMPVQVISKRDIELMGSRRLDEVLKEQTGVAIVNDVSAGSRAVGVQIQGFSSNYVMVLIDGQPILGRNNGNLDLSRISISNIERIEIIKGAASCLYGSDALGAAINIISKHGAITPQFHSSLLYGTLNTLDGTLEFETPFKNQRGSLVLSSNFYRTDGFNTDSKFLNKNSTTFPPYQNLSLQGRARYRITKDATLGMTMRLAHRYSEMIHAWSNEQQLKDNQTDKDLQLGLTYDWHLNPHTRSMSRYYLSGFQSKLNAQWLNQNMLANLEEFQQTIHRLEQQFSYQAHNNFKLTGGLGGSLEIMDNEQLDKRRPLQSLFSYLQSEWKPISAVSTTLGLRFDLSNIYQAKLSPSIGFQYNINSKLSAKLGIGAGFKAPDYKMLYQVFYNPSANYLVVGTDRIREIIDLMDSKSEISYKNSYLINLVSNNLKAESSLSKNLSINWNPSSNFQTEFTLFHHQIKNQLNTVNLGSGTTIEQIFSYRNLPKAINKGIETSITYRTPFHLELSFGYQYLIAKDLSVLDSISTGNYPYHQINNPKNSEYRTSHPNDYWGLEDRSRHMFNFKALYYLKPLDMHINLRANIRGKYPFQEINGNQFIDPYDAFVPAHTLVNLTLEKHFLKERLTCKIIADNLTNYTHRFMLGQPGRMLMAGLNYRWIKYN